MDMRAFNEDVIRRYRAGEEIEGLHRERLVLLTTIGRRTGQQHTAPMMFVEFEGDPLVVASDDGAAEHPSWFLNVLSDPHVTVETPDGTTRRSVAEPLVGETREAAWTDLVAGFPFFEEQQSRAGGRVIPLVRLRPAV